MSIENANVFIEDSGKMIPPKRYVFIQAAEDNEQYEIIVDAPIGDMLNFMFLLWEAIKEETTDMSDQDLYELCDIFDLDFDVFKSQMRG